MLLSPPAAADGEIFEDVAAATGLDFVHFNGMTGELYFPEMTGQGGALLDYDGDGDLDVYLVQGALMGPGETMDDALFPFAGEGTPLDRLYRNDAAAGPGGATLLRFVDVTGASGLEADGYGMGVAVGDVDGDGFDDLYVTNYGPNQLWRSRGDGTFEEVAAAAGADDPSWSTSAAFVDYDADGDLDLYVVNYVDFDVAANPRCFATSSRRDYCGPSSFSPLADRLLENRGDGTFDDVTRRVLRDYRPGPGLGVVSGDFNGDSLPDLYVANDGAPNQMWINRGDGTFVEEALFAGTAVNRSGAPEASMGVAAGDFDLDGDEDLFMTHLMDESNTLYVNDGAGLFEDRTAASGLAAVSLPYTAFGTGWIDYDNDGLPDLVALNGAVRIQEELAAAGDPYPLEQPNQLFHNLGGRFEEVSDRAGEAFTVAEVSRGAAFGDVDNDGDTDILVLNNNGPARLLLNRAGDGSGWLGVRPLDRAGRRLPGARVALRRADGRTVTARSRTDGSYCSANDPRVVLGLAAAGAETAEVDGLRGGRWRLAGPPERRYLVWYRSASP
ncbi:MAG: VCBS repeat-containing protein [Thermoanaerobaculia bacterium]|nr:VCBS repeat-containing protein [Thermoanaerobaculia bacterium]